MSDLWLLTNLTFESCRKTKPMIVGKCLKNLSVFLSMTFLVLNASMLESRSPLRLAWRVYRSAQELTAVSKSAYREHHADTWTCQWIFEHVSYISASLIKLWNRIYWDNMDQANPQFSQVNTWLYTHWGIRIWLWVKTETLQALIPSSKSTC